MRFTKMQGAGNDFILVENLDGSIDPAEYPRLAARLCQRRLSVGADGFMVIEPPRAGGDVRMAFFNSDGSAGEMCGNGARCISRYAVEHGFGRGGEVAVETTAGLVTGRRVSKRMYTVRLNDPSVIDLHREVEVDGARYDCAYLELGDPGIPHCVALWDGWREVPENELREILRKMRWFKGFPKGANVTVCRVDGENSVDAKTFERGVEDFTLACGTGCGSTVAALTLRGLVSGVDTKIAMPGGVLYVTVDTDGGSARNIMLTGPTNVVAEGEALDEDL